MNSQELYQKAYDCLYKKNDLPTALNCYNQIIEDFPDSDEAVYSKAQISNISMMKIDEK